MERSLLYWYYRLTIQKLRYEGPHFVLLRLATKSSSLLGPLGLLNFFQKDLTQPLKVMRAKVELTVSEASKPNLDELTELVKQRYGPLKNLEWYSKLGIRETILQRFQRGHKCFVGKIGGEIVHYNWIFFNWEETEPGTGCYIHLKKDEALCNDGFTVEQWRGRSIHTEVNNGMLRFLQQAEYRKVYTIVGAQNKSSRKALYRVGWQHSGTMLYFMPRGTKKARIWRISGTLNPFVEEGAPGHEVKQ